MNAYNHAEFSLTHKRSEIDAEERRLIDEAIEAGKVQKIPQGKSAFSEDYVWQGHPNNPGGLGKLVPVNPMTIQERRKKFSKRFWSQRKSTPAIIQRRAEVLRLTREGFSGPVIAEYLSCDEGVVSNDRKYWHDKGELPKMSPGANGKTQEELERRREKVLKLVNSGKQNREIAEELGETMGAIQNDRQNLIKQGRLRRAVGGRLCPTP